MRHLVVLWRVPVNPAVAPWTSSLGPVDQDPDDVRSSACNLLNPSRSCRPATPRPDPDPGGSLDWLAALVELFVWLMLAAVLGALVWLLVRAVMRRSPRARAKRAGDDEVETLDEMIIDTSREPGSWRAEADRLAAQGRVREALRCRYRALVGDLARRRLLHEIPGRTTGEERDQLSATAPSVRPVFDAAADLFDSAWYGDLSVDAGDLERFVAWENDVLARVQGSQR